MPVQTVHIVQRLAPGGIETLVLDLLRSGSEGSKVYSLDGTSESLIAGWPALEPLRDYVVAFGREYGVSPGLLFRLVRQLAVDRPQAVVAHHIGPYLYGGIAARLAHSPVFVHVEHDAWHLEQPRHRTLTKVLETLLRPRHVAVTGQIANGIRNICPNADVRVIENGIDLERFSPGDKAEARKRLCLPTDAPIVGSVGRLVAVKGHDILVRAAALLPGSVHIVIVGDGPELANLQVLAKELGVLPRLHLLGHRDDIAAILPAFDLFCLPSRSEGLPRAVIEAQACGIPVVASDVGGVRAAVCPKSGQLVPSDDPAALKDALRQSLRRQSAIAPRSFVEANFAWSATLARYSMITRLKDAA